MLFILKKIYHNAPFLMKRKHQAMIESADLSKIDRLCIRGARDFANLNV